MVGISTHTFTTETHLVETAEDCSESEDDEESDEEEEDEEEEELDDEEEEPLVELADSELVLRIYWGTKNITAIKQEINKQ